jgi:hypothetical protein
MTDDRPMLDIALELRTATNASEDEWCTWLMPSGWDVTEELHDQLTEHKIVVRHFDADQTNNPQAQRLTSYMHINGRFIGGYE